MSKKYWEWEQTFRINPNETALLIIDMQNGFIEPGAALEVPMARRQVPLIAELASFCREKKIPVLYSSFEFDKNHCYDFYYKMASQRGMKCDETGNYLAPGNPETAIYSQLSPKEGDIVFPKFGYDCFGHSDLEKILQEKGIRTLVICGTVVNWCVDSTVRSAFHKDYNVVVIADGVSGFDQASLAGEKWTEIELDHFAEAFARVLSAKDFMSQIS